MVKVMVTGSRNWSDRDAVHEALDKVSTEYGFEDVVVLQGECPTGADAHAREWCELDAQECVAYPPDPNRPRREALLARNRAMVAAGPDVVLAFIDPGSRGTWHSVTAALEAGIEVRVFGSQVADAKLVSDARAAAAKLVANGGWSSSRRRALALAFAGVRSGAVVAPGLSEAIAEELAR